MWDKTVSLIEINFCQQTFFVFGVKIEEYKQGMINGLPFSPGFNFQVQCSSISSFVTGFYSMKMKLKL